MNMKVDIWSDIRCPFCYIGKRKFETALENFVQNEQVEVVWHSFQLDPELKTQPEIDVYDYLASRKGQSREWSIQMHQQVEETARQVGLTFNTEQSVVANSFNAHRLIQMAKKSGLGDMAEEALFKAYFTDGKNIDDETTLLEIGLSIGLDATAVKEMLASDAYSVEVQQDELRAQTLGVRGVPFFVFNDKYGLSGAQDPEIFLQALQQSWQEFEQTQVKPFNNSNTAACSIDGNC